MGIFSIKNNLRNTLILSFMSTYLIPILVVLILVFTYTYNDTKNNTLGELQTMSDAKADQISLHIAEHLQATKQLSESQELASFIEGLQRLQNISNGEERESQFGILTNNWGIPVKQMFVQNGFIRLAVFERTQGTLLFDYNLSYADFGRSLSDRVATADQKAQKEVVRTSGIAVIKDASIQGSIDHSIVYYAIPLYDSTGNFSHVLLAGHNLELINLMTSIDYGRFKSRDTILVNNRSVILTQPNHPTQTKNLGSVSEHALVQMALQNFPSRNSTIIEEQSVSTYGSYSPVRFDKLGTISNEVSWVVVSSMQASEVRQLIINELVVILIVMLLVGIGVFFFARFLATSIAKPIQNLTVSMNHLAEGDLTNIPETERGDEIGLLMETTAKMVIHWKTIMNSLKEAVNISNQISSTVFASVEQQSAISVEQAGSITEISSTMDEFTSSFAQVSESVEEVSKLTNEIYQKIAESVNLIDSVAHKMRDINTDNTRDIDYITQLKTKSKDISKIMEIINKISDQTKIISFNAALEASSAGEAGKRFAVVAAEIRKLTEDVIHSTTDIDNLVSEIQSLSDKMVMASEKTTKNIHHGLEAADDSVQNIETIVGSIKKSNEATKQIVLAVQQQQTAALQIQSGLKELSEGARQNSEAIQSISESDAEYRSVTNNLSTIIAEFKTKED